MDRRLHGVTEVSDNLRVLRSNVVGFRGNQGTVAERYVQHLETKGYELSDLPELDALVNTSHFVRVLSNGLYLDAIAIIDRERDPAAETQLSPRDLRDIAQSCLQYTGTISGAKLPAVITVLEIGPDILTPASCRRLQPYKSGGFSDKAMVQAQLVDTATGDLWSNKRVSGFFWKRRFQRFLNMPLNQRLEASAPVELAQAQWIPFFSSALALILVVVFAAELLRGSMPRTLGVPTLESLAALGAVSRQGVLWSLQGWRLLTAPLLHASTVHLLSNIVALIMIGIPLERTIPRTWCATIFAVGAIAGGLVSVVTLPTDTLSVGASGGILALCAAGLMLFSRIRTTEIWLVLLLASLSALVPALLPFSAQIAHGQAVDLGAHLGGIAAGAAAGWFIRRRWPEARSTPAPSLLLSFGGPSILIAGVGLVCWRILAPTLI